jgi:ubiquinone/menaquinone biosynthesis C-methylase UbiE
MVCRMAVCGCLILWQTLIVLGYVSVHQQPPKSSRTLAAASSSSSAPPPEKIASPPSGGSSSSPSPSLQRTGVGHALLNFALKTPLWKKLLVPAARQKIVDTAEANGIPWRTYVRYLQSDPDGPWNNSASHQADVNNIVKDLPKWYRECSYHGYEKGHLCWDAALEMEIAGAAVGARNLPKAGRDGEQVWRNLFAQALRSGGAKVAWPEAVIVDFGCGTGMSTRLLAMAYPTAKEIVGLDLSPYFIETAKRLLSLSPSKASWVNDIENDERIRFVCGDASKTTFADHSVDVVSLQFVTHETPLWVTLEVIQEALRILKKGGQLWFCEMDFEAPAYAAQRGNPLLFSLLRATEPYLDEYAEGQPIIWDYLSKNFETVTIVPATGRHFACVATKGDKNDQSLDDKRFDTDGNYRVEDTHLQLWEVSRS